MGKAYTARNCRVAVKTSAGVFKLLATRVTVRTNADRIDVSNFESGTDVATNTLFGEYLAGIVTATVTIETFDSDDAGGANDHWAAGLKSGFNSSTVVVGEVFIYLTVPHVVAASWYFGAISVNDVSSDNEVHGAVKSMITFFNRGRFYYPGEAKPVAAFGDAIP